MSRNRIIKELVELTKDNPKDISIALYGNWIEDYKDYRIIYGRLPNRKKYTKPTFVKEIEHQNNLVCEHDLCYNFYSQPLLLVIGSNDGLPNLESLKVCCIDCGVEYFNEYWK